MVLCFIEWNSLISTLSARYPKLRQRSRRGRELTAIASGELIIVEKLGQRCPVGDTWRATAITCPTARQRLWVTRLFLVPDGQDRHCVAFEAIEGDIATVAKVDQLFPIFRVHILYRTAGVR